MKKYLLLLIGMFMFLPFIVNADSYEVVVTNPDGTEVYKDVENEAGGIEKQVVATLNYNDTITITGEILEFEGAVYVEGYGEYAYIYVNDIKPSVEEYEVDVSKLDDEIPSTVLKEVKIYSGPSTIYNVIGSIEKGKKIKVRILVEDYGNFQEETDWGYVEYNGISGFVNTGFEGATDTAGNMSYGNPVTIMVTKDVKINSSITIPANTILKNAYVLDRYSGAYQITYKNKTKTIGASFVVRNNDKVEFKTLGKVKVYKTIKSLGDFGDKVLTTLIKGESFTSEFYTCYHSVCTIYYKNGKTEGWIHIDSTKEVEKKLDKLYKKFCNNIEYCSLNENGRCEGSEEVTPTQEETPIVIDPAPTEQEHIQIDSEMPDPTTIYESKKEVVYFTVSGVIIGAVITLAIIAIVVNRKKKNGTL